MKQLSVFLLEFGLQVIVGQTVTFQFCHLLLQITDLRKMSKFLIHFLNSTFFFTFTSDIGPQTFFFLFEQKKTTITNECNFPHVRKKILIIKCICLLMHHLGEPAPHFGNPRHMTSLCHSSRPRCLWSSGCVCVSVCTFSVMSRSQESMLSVNRSSVLLA